ncbi:MAG: phosphotransferase family protein [Anaerolineae bacterium]
MMVPDTAARLQHYLAVRYPTCSSLQVLGLANINTGWESDVYALDLAYGPPSARICEPLILRLYPGEGAARKAAAEFQSLALLAAQGYPVPHVSLLECDATTFGQPFVLMERVPGTLMGRLMHGAPPEVSAGYLRQAMELLVRLHRLDWRAFVSDAAAYESADGHAQVRRTLEEWARITAAYPLEGAAKALAWFQEHLAEVPPGRPAVIHLDFHQNNILVADDGSARVIDWTCLTVSDPRLDLAWTLVVNHGAGPALRAAIVAAYERAAGEPVRGLGYFDLLACWRRVWSVTVALLHGAGSLGMRPGAEVMIRRSLPEVASMYRAIVEGTGVRAPDVERLLDG